MSANEFLTEFYCKRLHNKIARSRGENTYVQELIEELILYSKFETLKEIFGWLRQNLDDYWTTLFPWTVEVKNLKDFSYAKITFDYKLNSKGEEFVLDSLCDKHSLSIPDEYFNKGEVEIDNYLVENGKEPEKIFLEIN